MDARNRVSQIGGLIAALIGAIVMVGWWADLEPLKRIVPGLVAMNPTTACCFIALGLAMILIADDPDIPWRAWFGRLVAVLVFSIGIIKLGDLIAGDDSGVDRQIFAAKLVGPRTLNINAMAPNTALNFALVGFAMLVRSLRPPRLQALVQTSILLTLLSSTIAVIGYAYGALGLYQVRAYFPMALLTAVTFLAVSVGLLAERPYYGVVAIMTSRRLGGTTARRLVTGVIVLPILLGLFWLKGMQTHQLASVTGIAIFVSANIVVLAGIVLRIAVQLDQTAVRLEAHAAALEQANHLADAASRAKSDFLANMSHEIRTPMNGVLGMLEVLAHTGLRDEQIRILDTIRSSGLSLLTIIDDILDFSKIEAGRLKIGLETCDPSEIAETTARLYLGAAHAKGIALRCYVGTSIRGPVLADPVRLRQILGNFVSNAVKFTAQGSVTITVDLVGAQGDRANLRMCVADTGIGIPPAAQAQLFNPFTQGTESTARQFGGTGLGLSICLRLAQLMGGQIDLASIEGQGTSITLLQPVQVIDPGVRISPLDLSGIRIALVGADAIEADYFSGYFSYWGAEVAALDLDQPDTQAVPAPFTVVVAPVAAMEAVRKATEGAKAIPVVHPCRMVFYTFDDEVRDRLLPTNDAVVTTALSRARLVTAVAVAAARVSPEIEAPQLAPEAMAAVSPDRGLALREGRLILLVEDHPVNRDVIMRQLGLLGYAADAVENGVAALAALAQTPYGLILTDCSMPEMDGFELTRHVRSATNVGSRLPIIALTANAMNGEAERCLAADMDDYMAKPVEMRVLRKCLERWLAPVLPDVSPLSDDDGTGVDYDDPASIDPALGPLQSDVSPVAAINLAVVADCCGGVAAAVNEILSVFTAAVTLDLERLATAINRNDVTDARFLTHRIRGAARAVDGVRIVACSDGVDAAVVSGDWDLANAELAGLSSAFHEADRFIALHRGANGAVDFAL